MHTLEEIGLEISDLIILGLIVACSFIFTQWIFTKYIEIAKKKGWIGYDIHKNSHPEVAESGGLAFIIGIIPAMIIIIFLFPEIRNESIVFFITILFSGIIGFIDDRLVLSSRKKIILMLLTGGPIFLLNLNFINFINIEEPIIPILGQLRLNIIYPFAIPIIITILTNAVNMLEGYNGEGSGTSLIAIVFLLICSIISGSSEGLIFSLAILGSLVAFVKFNKFPAKVFPGDVGTLALGASIACVGIFGSLEVAMFCTILVHIFNGFYVISSLKGFKESHTIDVKDIIVTENDMILPSKRKNAPLTLPRLILAEKPLTEPELVKNFWVLSIIGGLFALVAEIFIQFTIKRVEIFWVFIIFTISTILIILLIIKYKGIRGITYFMVSLLVLGLVFLFIIDVILSESSIWNSLISGLAAGIGFLFWYFLTKKYFWYKISKLDKNSIEKITEKVK